MFHIIQQKWRRNLDECLKQCVEEFLKNPQFSYILQDITILLQENKVVEAYSYCTNVSEYFRVKSKASLFLEFRELLEPTSPECQNRRWNKQLLNLSSWYDINTNPEDVISCFTGSTISDIQIPHPSTVNQYSLQSKSYMIKGLALHDKFAAPIARRILKELIDNHQEYEVWEPGRLIHPTLYFMACTPDIIISHRKTDFYKMMDDLHAKRPLSSELLTNNAVQAVFELKTFHKAKITKQTISNVLDMIRIGHDGVKKQLVKIIIDTAVKQQILPASKTREKDFQYRAHSKKLDGFSKTNILYPTDEFLMLDVQTMPTNQLGFISKMYKEYEWPMEHLCSKSTIGRAWVFVYDPSRSDDLEPTQVVFYEKSPFILLPKSKVYRQMLEQRCVIQHYNSDAVSLFIGMFCAESDDMQTDCKGSYNKTNTDPGIVLVIETKINTETTRAFEECALVGLNQWCPQALGIRHPLPVCELGDIIKSVVWSQELEKNTSYGLGNYNPEKDATLSVLTTCFV